MKNIIAIMFLLITTSIQLYSQWSTNYKSNLQITDWGIYPMSAASDGKGGMFISIDKSVSTRVEAYAYLYLIDKYGYKKWNEPIHLGLRDWQDKVELIEDGSGGVIAGIRDLTITWDGLTIIPDYKIIVQKIDSSGNKLWGNGVLVSTDTTDQFEFDICADGNGGCYVSWLSEKTMDYINSDGYRALQHISSGGERLWSDTGKVIYTGGVSQISDFWYQIVPNGKGGILTINTPNLSDFYYLNIDFNGDVIWETQSRFDSYHKDIYSSNIGDLCVFASEWDSEHDFLTIKIDKLGFNGNFLLENPIILANSMGGKSQIIDMFFNTDSSISIYFRDQDLNGTTHGSFYQQVSKTGELKFLGKGITPFDFENGGSAMLKSFDDYICISGDYAQKLTLDGERLWGGEGVQFSNRLADYADYVSDKKGGFIKVWLESLNGLWTQQVSVNGNLGEIITNVKNEENKLPNHFELYQNYPNPFNPSTIISFNVPIGLSNKKVRLSIVDIQGEEVNVLVNENLQAGNYLIPWNGKTKNGMQASSGIYFYKINISDKHFVGKMNLIK